MPERKMGTILTEFKVETKEIREAAQLIDSLRKTLTKLGVEGSEQTRILQSYLTLYTEGLAWTTRSLEALRNQVEQLDTSLAVKNELLAIGNEIVEKHREAHRKGGKALLSYNKSVFHLNRLLLQESKIRKYLGKIGLEEFKNIAYRLAPATLQASVTLGKMGASGRVVGSALLALGPAVSKLAPQLISLAGSFASLAALFVQAYIEGFNFLDITADLARETPIMTNRLEEATHVAYLLGEVYGYSAEESATALAIMSKGLFKTTDELYEATATTLQFGRAFGLSGKEAGELGLTLVRKLFIPSKDLPYVFEGISKSITSVGLSAKEVSNVLAGFAKSLVWMSEAQKKEAIPGLAKLAGAVRSAGVSTDWMNRMIATAHKLAIDPEAYQALMQGLSMVGAQAGITGQELMEGLKEEPAKAIETILGLIGKFNKENVSTTYAVNELAKAVGLSVEEMFLSAEAIKDATKRGKTLGEVWKETMQTIGPLVTQLTTSLQHLFVDVGVPLLKFIIPAWQSLATILRTVFFVLHPIFLLLSKILEILTKITKYTLKIATGILSPVYKLFGIKLPTFEEEEEKPKQPRATPAEAEYAAKLLSEGLGLRGEYGRRLEQPRVEFRREDERIVGAINSFKNALIHRWDTAEGRRAPVGVELPWATEGVY